MLKHTTTADSDYRLMYYRDADKFEVDVVIESAAGQLVGVEVKASANLPTRNNAAADFSLTKSAKQSWQVVCYQGVDDG